MIEFVVFKPRHLAALRLQAAQAGAQQHMNEARGQEIEDTGGRAFTMLLDGRPIACAGAYEIAPGRAYLWSYLSDEALRHFKALHRYAFKVVRQLPWRRVEAYSDTRQLGGARWLLRLGFQFEGVARAWAPDGRDMRQFARVK